MPKSKNGNIGKSESGACNSNHLFKFVSESFLSANVSNQKLQNYYSSINCLREIESHVFKRS